MDEEDAIPEWKLQFGLWCLNPAIAFWELNAKAHSIILTSGTLAPLDTFASEVCLPALILIGIDSQTCKSSHCERLYVSPQCGKNRVGTIRHGMIYKSERKAKHLHSTCSCSCLVVKAAQLVHCCLHSLEQTFHTSWRGRMWST